MNRYEDSGVGVVADDEESPSSWLTITPSSAKG